MAHSLFCTCKRCNPSLMDMFFDSPKKSKKPNFQNRSNKSQQSRQQSANRAENQRNRNAGGFGSRKVHDTKGKNNHGRSY